MTVNAEIKTMLDELELYGYNMKRVAKACDYKEESIKRALRGTITPKMYNKIKALHTMAKEKAANPVAEMYQEIKYLKVTTETLFIMLADLLAKQTNRSSAIIKSEYEKLRDDKLKE